MAYDSLLEDSSQKRNTFIKFLMMGGAIGAMIGIFFFVMNYQESFENNPLAFGITFISLVVILVGFYLINKSRMDLI